MTPSVADTQHGTNTVSTTASTTAANPAVASPPAAKPLSSSSSTMATVVLAATAAAGHETTKASTATAATGTMAAAVIETEAKAGLVTETGPHIKARTTPYLNGPERLPVPDDKVPWSVSWSEYAPVEYVAPPVEQQPVWADDPARISDIKFNTVDGKVNRVSFQGHYTVDKDGRPLNPCGRTGMCERGLLGRYGPNHAADPVVTRWKRDAAGDVVMDAHGLPTLEFVGIKRRDNGEWAIPGGMVAPGETVSLTLKREFGEEAFNTIEATAEQRADIEARLQAFFKDGDTVYCGYVDDPRNTDNAWMETVVQNFHDEDGTITADFKLHAGDDAGDVSWMTISPELQLYASHAHFLRALQERHVQLYHKKKTSDTKKRRVSTDR